MMELDNADGQGTSSSIRQGNSVGSNDNFQSHRKAEQLMKLKKSRVLNKRPAHRLSKKRADLLHAAANNPALARYRKPVRMFHCDICDFRANNRLSLQRHVKSAHAKDLKFLCTACGKRFADQRDLSNHVEKNNITTSDGIWQMACSKFRKVPSEAGEYLFTDEDTGEVKCLKCNYSSTEHKSSKRHVEQIHLKLYNRFICNACSESFSTKVSLAVHLKDEHRDFSLVEKFSIPEETTQADLEERPASPMFECKDCAYTTKFRRSLYRHVISIHTKEKRFSCEDCGTNFAEHHELMRHVKINSFMRDDGKTGVQFIKTFSSSSPTQWTNRLLFTYVKPSRLIFSSKARGYPKVLQFKD